MDRSVAELDLDPLAGASVLTLSDNPPARGGHDWRSCRHPEVTALVAAGAPVARRAWLPTGRGGEIRYVTGLESHPALAAPDLLGPS
jgi:hypothetical protein